MVDRLKRTGPRTKPWGTLQIRGDAGEMCGGMTMADVQDERYEVNHCSEREEMPNQIDDEAGWSGQEYQRWQIDQEGKGKRGDA